MKIRPVGAELFHADGQTDEQADRHDEANIHFTQFCDLAYKRLRTFSRVTWQSFSNVHMNRKNNLIVMYEVAGAWGGVVVKALRY